MEQRWKRAEAEHKKLPLDLKSVKWECSLCKEEKGFEEFGVDGGVVRFRCHIVQQVLAPGAWRSCMRCNSNVRSSTSTSARASDQVRCRGCDLWLAEQKFDRGDLAALRKNGLASTGASSRAVCLGCAPTMPRNRRDASVTLRCSTCMKDLPLKTFDADRVREWRRSDALRFVKCMACDPIKSAASMHTCNKCKENLPLCALGAQMQKLHGTQKWRCDHCQRPACTECGARPTKPFVVQCQHFRIPVPDLLVPTMLEMRQIASV